MPVHVAEKGMNCCGTAGAQEGVVMAQVQLREQRCRFSLQEPEMCLSCKSGGASSAVLPRSVSKARVCPVQEERQSWFQSGLVICQD